MATPDELAFKAPYMSFQTYWNFLADLTSKPLPPKLDRSIMTNKSGTDQTAIMSALESFGFVDSGGTVLPDLVQFKEADPEARKSILRDQIEVFYDRVLEVSSANGTHQNLKEVFSEAYGVTGDTQRKAITFFLHAAREAGIPLSDHFPKTRAGSGSPGTPKSSKKSAPRKRSNGVKLDTPDHQPPPSRGQTHTIRLASGGSVTLTIDVDMFEIGDEDMAFTLGLVTSLREYKAAHSVLAGDASASTTAEGGAS